MKTAFFTEEEKGSVAVRRSPGFWSAGIRSPLTGLYSLSWMSPLSGEITVGKGSLILLVYSLSALAVYILTLPTLPEDPNDDDWH